MVEINYKEMTPSIEVEKLITKVVQTVLKIEKIKHDVDVYITLTNNEEIHKINKEYRNVDRPTDVLSFPMYERSEIDMLRKPQKEALEEILGDILISLPKVKEQSEEYGHSYERELAYLTAHGMLHLLGYDHILEEEKTKMREQEEKVMEELNLKR